MRVPDNRIVFDKELWRRRAEISSDLSQDAMLNRGKNRGVAEAL